MSPCPRTPSSPGPCGRRSITIDFARRQFWTGAVAQGKVPPLAHFRFTSRRAGLAWRVDGRPLDCPLMGEDTYRAVRDFEHRAVPERKVRGNLQAKRHAPPARAGGGAVVQGGHAHECKDEMEWRSLDRRAAARCKPCLGFDRGEPELPRRKRRIQPRERRRRRSRQRLQHRGLRDGPASGLAFERVFGGGTLFGTDSNQGVRGAPGDANDTSRVVTIGPDADGGRGVVRTFIGGLPTGDHPTEQVLVKDGFVYWSQGSATNSGVVGHDNGGTAGPNEHEIACQQITLSDNVFASGDHLTSGYSVHGRVRRGAIVPPFEDAKQAGMCTGAILRAPINVAHPETHVEPFSWGYRNPFGIRFPPKNHLLGDGLFVTENGEDERGARPTNNAPDRLQFARQNADGSPDYHGWPD